MRYSLAILAAISLAAAARGAGGAEEIDTKKPRLPEGDNGIAAKYPGDVGIEGDADVIKVERFEYGDVSEVKKNWEEVKNLAGLSLDTDVPPGSRGKKSILFTHVGKKGTGSHLYQRLKRKDGGGFGYDQVYARFYLKFDKDCGPVHHFGTNLGGNNPATRWPMVSAGNRTAGNKSFWSGLEPGGWTWDYYTYWQGSHPHGDGRYWGTPFLAGGGRPKVVKNKWICIEMMMKINDDPSKKGGEQAFWIDGKLFRRDGQVVSHIGPGFPKGRWRGGWWGPDPKDRSGFEGYAWRSVKDYNVNYVWIYVYITKAPAGHVSKIWFDDVVVAKKYIGPLCSKKPKAEVNAPAAGPASRLVASASPVVGRKNSDEREAGRIYAMARQAGRMGQRDVARSLYEQIVEKFPGTEVAKKARAKLDR